MASKHNRSINRDTHRTCNRFSSASLCSTLPEIFAVCADFVARQRPGVAGFQTCCIADFQIGGACDTARFAGLETHDTADLEVCATSVVAWPRLRSFVVELQFSGLLANTSAMKNKVLHHHLRIRKAILVTALSVAIAFVRAAETPPKPLFPDATPVCPCESLARVSLPNTTIDSAAIDSSDGSCRVTATVTHRPSGDRVRIFIGLPATNWNGRFRGTGGGGFLGGSANNLRGPVTQGYAAGATDTGHEGGSGSFALDGNGRLNLQSIVDNAYLGIHEMTVVGKALTQAFYGKAPRYSYFMGGSTGGRQGLMEAQRYPNDYDGIVSACPAINWHRFLPADLWPQVVMLAATNFMPKSKFDSATAAAVAAYDALDGVTDGVIDDPARCVYDPKTLVGSESGGSAFTEAD